MGIFESIKSTFNIGGARIGISLEAEECRLGGPVAGQVCVRGGGYRQEADALRLDLEEFWTESRGSGKNRRTVTVTRSEAALRLAAPFDIDPGGEVFLPFTLPLPLHGRLSEGRGSTGWRLKVEMDIPGAVDPWALQPLVVGPSAPIRNLIRVVSEDLRWQEVPSGRRWNRIDAALALFFRPPTELEAEFDDLTIFCRRVAGGWDLGLEFDLQEKSVGDWFRSLVCLDEVMRRLHASDAELDPSQPQANRLFAIRLAGLMKELVDKRAR